MNKILTISLVLLAVSIMPSSFAWDGLMAMDADKRNVERGQIITYQGYLYGDYPIEGELVSITIYEKETKEMVLQIDTIPEAVSVEYFENTAWPFTFQVGTSYKEFVPSKTYVVEARYDDKSTKLDFFIQPESEPPCFEMLEENPIMVLTDKEKYDQGDIIKVSGCLSEEAFTKGINIVVYDPKGNKIGVSTIEPNLDRTFSEEFIIDERFGLNGTYSVEVDAGGLYSSTKSFVVPEFGTIAIIIFGISFAMILINNRVFRLTNFVRS